MKWPFHILFWFFAALYVFDYLIDVFPWTQAVQYTAFEVGVLIAEFYLNLKLLVPRLVPRKRYFLYAFSILVILGMGYGTYWLFGLGDLLLSEDMLRSVISFALNHVFFLLISFSVWYVQQYFEEKNKALVLEKDNLRKELLLLKSQISPHFLFNALNNIYSLSVAKHENTPEMIAALSGILRHYFSHSTAQWIAVEQEIEAARKYVLFQKLRKLPGAAGLKWEEQGSFGQCRMPPFVFLTLLENAFKHGDAKVSDLGFISVLVREEKGRIYFRIRNSFGERYQDGGTGLENILEQMRLVYRRDFEFEILEEENIFTVQVAFNGKYPA